MISLATNILKCDDLFDTAPELVRGIFLDLQRKVRYSSGSTIFAQGENPAGAFLVRRGHVRIAVAHPAGARLSMQAAQPGEVLGFTPAITGHPHEFTAVAARTSELGFIRRDELWSFLREHSEICLRLIELLSAEIYRVHKRIRLLQNFE